MSHADVIGGRASRLDAWDKVSGRTVYPGDLHLDGMLHAAVVRSPHPHARVRRIDPGAARSLSGVVAVVTGDEFDGPNAYGLMIPDQPALACTGGEVRYVGDAVAALAAETAEAAEAARALVEVEYEPLPGVFDPRAALAPGAPLVHGERGTNLLHEVHLRRGDLEAGFAQADVVVEGEYETPFIDHAYLQPEAGVAQVDGDGRVTVWVGTQWPHEDRRQIAQALGLPEVQVRVVQMATGGAFGGREDINVQIVLALLALKTQRPVRLVWERTDSLVASTKRHPFHLRYRTGARRDGRLTAMEIELVSNAGAYASTSAAVLTTAVTVATGPYEVPNVQVDARCAYTNTPTAAAMRGFGSNQVNLAAEIQMGKLAAALAMDPAELRRRNLYRDGSTMHTGQHLPRASGAIRTLDAAVKRAAEMGMVPGQRMATDKRMGGARRRGVGVACGFKNIGYNLGWDDKSTAVVELWPDRAVVKIGTCDVGQGSTTIFAQMAATVLELPLSSIQMVVSDTDVVPDSGSCSASRSTWLTGSAVMRAAAEAERKLAALGPNPPAHLLPVAIEHTYHAPATTPLDPEAGPGAKPNFAYAYGAQVIEVEVDLDTGEVRALRAVAAHDVGRAINPTHVEGQIDGGFVMGQGYGMMEEHLLLNGRPQTTTLATFLMPTILDVPEIERVILETAEPEGPAGATGIGEIPMLPTPGAIAAAIYDATGAWVDRLPCSPEAVLRAMGRV
jgi:CO/xanthine dehydrogenase Mo-binding subunit